MKLVAGNSNGELAEGISNYLSVPLTGAEIRRFADGEVFVEIHENVRGEDVFILQSTSRPANEHVMELLICMDALRRASARRITAVVPYFGYARQDRKPGPRTPISAKLVANLIVTAGANRVLTLDLHAGQIQGFFDIPTDNLFSVPVFSRDIMDQLPQNNLTVVRPLRVGNRHYIQAVYENRYQKELGRGLRLAWQMLTREFRNLSVLLLFILLHVAGILDRRGYGRAADRIRTWVSLPAVERGMSKMLRTRLRFVITELGGAALDIDNEADLAVAEKMMGRWKAKQADLLSAG